MLVDSHCHIDGSEFAEDIDAVIERAEASGVRSMLCVGTGDVKSGEVARAVEVARRYPNVFASVGVHPHDAVQYDDEVDGELLKLAADENVIAWGEIGLDYYYDHSPREIQKSIFRRQIENALVNSLPIIVHTRDAEEDTIEILRSYGSSGLKGVMHCFSGSEKAARIFLGLGFYISFAGNVTFKKAEELRGVAKTVPIDRILVETDCPYMSPEPLRGRRNEPSHVVHTARLLAELTGVSEEKFADVTTSNFQQLFNVKIPN